MDLSTATPDELRLEMQRLADSNPGKAAEFAYALAAGAAQRGASQESREYRDECLRLLAAAPRETSEECATHYAVLGGVGMPEFLHEGVVEARLNR